MKHRTISLITVLALCLSLCPVRALAAGADPGPTGKFTVKNDTTKTGTYSVTDSHQFDTAGYSYTITDKTAVSVKSTGRLYLTTGTIESKNGAGIEVLTGGHLYVDQADMTVIGTTYGLDISSGTTVRLSSGTFTGKTAAIRAAGGDYSALLKTGCAFYSDGNGDPLLPGNAAGLKTLKVKECTSHIYEYTATGGAPTHNWKCLACGTEGMEQCTFSFDENGRAECADCGHALEITINPDEVFYDGTFKPDPDPVTVTLDGATLAGTHYAVEYTTRKDVGEVTITVTVTAAGKSDCGTYHKTFRVIQAAPEIKWVTTEEWVDTDEPIEVPYDGSPVDDLPAVTVTAKTVADEAELGQLLYFSYKKDSDAVFTRGLPTDAGTYQIRANLPETQNYTEASSDPITLTIKKIDPITTPPEAVKPTYNKTEQKLVTGGTLDPRAVGAVIQFATSENGPWSTDIPTGTDAGDYIVYYKVDGTENYDGVGATAIQSVKIKRKEITPDVKLEYTSHAYTGGELQPAVTVSDKADGTVLPVTEYEVTYGSNTAVGTATVTITDKDKGNYKILTTTAKFEITPADQDSLTITNRPGRVVYGDVFTLETTGGSGEGRVTWEITAVKDGGGAAVEPEQFDSIAKIDDGGQVTVTGVGTVTVQATKDGTDFKKMTAEWTFTAGKRPVTATVAADDKTYDGTDAATATAVVKQGVVSGDTITITGLTDAKLSGTFSSADAGIGKTVTVTDTAVIKVNDNIIANNSSAPNEKYIVTIPTTATADITRAATAIKTDPTQITPAPIYNGSLQNLICAAAAEPTTHVDQSGEAVVVEYALNAGGSYSTAIPQATDAGSYEVWYRVRETNNYFGTVAEKVVVTIGPKTVTVSSSNTTLEPDSYVYDGAEKRPAVTVKDGETVIPPSEYTVSYSNNVNVGKATDTNPPTVTVTDNPGGNYTVSGTAKFTITAADAVLTSPPKAVENLVYNGNPQDLVSAGSVTGGHLEYSVDGQTNYSKTIPQGKDAKTYAVYYKVVSDGNHNDVSTGSVVYVTIQPKTVVNPEITLTASSLTYDGKPKESGVTSVKDDEGETIDSSEYSATYSNNTNAGTATVHIVNKSGGNYIINADAYFTIEKAGIAVSDTSQVTAPTPSGKKDQSAGNTELQYTGAAQELLEARGSSPYGKMVYSLDNIYFSEAIPTGTAVNPYTVYYKVLGDSNHKDSTSASVSVSIVKNTVAKPTITLSADTFRYNGSQQIPTVTVRDDKGFLIPEHEYEVTITGTKTGGVSAVDVDTYTIKITERADSNYIFQSNNTTTYRIVEADQETITIKGVRDQVYYGDTIQLWVEGGTGDGTVKWEVTSGISDSTDTPHNEITDGGQLKIREVGSVKVTATRTASGNYNTATTTWEFYANKKPVTAVLTGGGKTYDGTKGTTVKAMVNASDLISGDSIDDITLTGEFEDANAGTNKKITVTASSSIEQGNYVITIPDTAAADITPRAITPTVTVSPPDTGDYVYTGSAITPDVSVTYAEGSLSLQSGDYTVTYSNNINAGTATVTVKNVPGGNYTIDVTEHFAIAKATPDVTPPVGKTDLTYTGAAQALVFSGSTPHGQMMYALGADANYSADIPTGTAAGDYTIYYKVLGDSNHNSTVSSVTAKIGKADQNPLTIINLPGLVYYGDSFTLSAIGGSGTGAMTWESDKEEIVKINQTSGLVEVKGVSASGETVTITATKAGDTNYKEVTATWTFTAVQANAKWASEPKPATGLIYTGGEQPLLMTGATTVNGIGKVKYSLTQEGEYSLTIPEGTDAGTYKVWYKVEDDEAGKWNGIAPAYVEVTIAKAPTDSKITAWPTVSDTLIEGQSLKALSFSNDGEASVDGTFAWTDDSIVPLVGTSQQEVTFTPTDKNNYETATTQIEVTVNKAEVEEPDSTPTPGPDQIPDPTPDPTPDTSLTTPPTTNSGTANPGTTNPGTANPGTKTPSTQTSVRDGAASTVVNGAAGDQLVDEAVASRSENVVIKPEITGDVTKTEVSLPASTVGRLSSETAAALTVSTPVANVIIPNASLDTLSIANGTVSVVTERTENTVVLALTTGGQTIGDLPGGLTLTVPMENAGPGTVAVLVYEDGTRETIRWSVAENGEVRIPLDGSATVEIVDNSRKFADVPAENWAADAVTFASAHELFNGTGEATFSPELSMSRAMLATVLYNLEGQPNQNLADAFSDVGGGIWYAESVSWAAENGIVSGYGNGQFGPNDDITREQLAVMLWRYMGSPAADEQTLDFTDVDQASDYAMEALCWAAANGILRGSGDGLLDPCGLATRAQAAQMLKNFIVNT